MASNTYIVTWQVATVESANRLGVALQKYQGYCPIHANCWAILADLPASRILESLSNVVGAQDRLFVIRSGTEAAWRGSYGQEFDSWLQSNL